MSGTSHTAPEDTFGPKRFEEDVMGEYLLGIDIGTSACKIAVFNREGHVMEGGRGVYPVDQPNPGWAEQDRDE